MLWGRRWGQLTCVVYVVEGCRQPVCARHRIRTGRKGFSGIWPSLQPSFLVRCVVPFEPPLSTPKHTEASRSSEAGSHAYCSLECTGCDFTLHFHLVFLLVMLCFQGYPVQDRRNCLNLVLVVHHTPACRSGSVVFFHLSVACIGGADRKF